MHRFIRIVFLTEISHNVPATDTYKEMGWVVAQYGIMISDNFLSMKTTTTTTKITSVVFHASPKQRFIYFHYATELHWGHILEYPHLEGFSYKVRPVHTCRAIVHAESARQLVEGDAIQIANDELYDIRQHKMRFWEIGPWAKRDLVLVWAPPNEPVQCFVAFLELNGKNKNITEIQISKLLYLIYS